MCASVNDPFMIAVGVFPALRAFSAKTGRQFGEVNITRPLVRVVRACIQSCKHAVRW